MIQKYKFLRKYLQCLNVYSPGCSNTKLGIFSAQVPIAMICYSSLFTSEKDY